MQTAVGARRLAAGPGAQGGDLPRPVADHRRLRAPVLGARRRRRPDRRSSGPTTRWRTLDQGPELSLGEPELDVASGDDRLRASAPSPPATPATGWSPSRPTSGQALVHRPVARAAGADAGQARRRDAAVRPRRRGRRRDGRLGGRPQRPATGAPADHRRSRRSPAPRTSPRCPVEGDDEIARLATAFNQMLTALAASRDRQRQLVADAGHELRTPLTSLRTNLDLLTQADAQRPATCRPRPAPSCSTTSAPRSRS